MKHQQGDKVTFIDNSGTRTVRTVMQVNPYGFKNTVIIEKKNDNLSYPRETHQIVLLNEWNESNVHYGLPILEDE